MSSALLALLSPKVHHHRTDGNDETGKLRAVELVAIEVDTGHEGRYLPRQTNDRTGEGTKLGNGHKDEHLAHGTGQSEGHEQESHILTHLDEEMDLVENEQADASQDRLPELNVVHEVERPHGMDAHQLVLVGTGATIKAQRDEEEENAKCLRGCRQAIVVVVLGGTLLALALALALLFLRLALAPGRRGSSSLGGDALRDADDGELTELGELPIGQA
mmetsp:Transcript_720/g.2015  ORF Transcript_720/g.2015 Transcript_720/m.2015 type:complete len:218 (-) Transcript_720:328-981(-)